MTDGVEGWGWGGWRGLTYLLMIFRSRLKSIFSTAPAATLRCNRDVQLSAGLRKRYLMWIFPPVSIAHRRRRCVCDSEEQRSLSRLFWFSWHCRSQPCSDQAISTSHTCVAASRYIARCTACKPQVSGLVFPVAPRLLGAFSLAGDGPSWRQSVSCSVLQRWPSM